MILRGLKLENIRSYVSENIEFPEGSVLLSGDIGSGKSTILLAIEFAFFGIMRSGLTGSSLLRHGTNDGAVELKFEIEEKEYIIKRTLKRTKTAVSQQSGYLITDGRKFEGTPVELKAKLLHILGYPESLLTRAKSLIYRYTVYTAQEQMKQILFEDKDVRLDTLRKVFGIDKYKTIKENSVLFIRELKRKQSDYNIRLESYTGLDKEKTELKEKLSKLNESILTNKTELETVQKQVDNEKAELNKYEQEIEKHNELKKQVELKDLLIKTKTSSKQDIVKKINETKEKVESIKAKLESYSDVTEIKHEKEFENKLKEIEEKYSTIIKQKASFKEKNLLYSEQLTKLEKEINELTEKSKESIMIKAKLDELKTRLDIRPDQEKLLQKMLRKEKDYLLRLEKYSVKENEANELINTIKAAEVCPTCDQNITPNHRVEVIFKQKQIIKQNQEKKQKITELLNKIKFNIETINKNLDSLAELENKYSEQKEQLARLDSVSDDLIKKQKELSRIYEKKKQLKQEKTVDETELKQIITEHKSQLTKIRDNNLKYREKKNLVELNEQNNKNLESYSSDLEKIDQVITKTFLELNKLKETLQGYSKIIETYEVQKQKVESVKEKQKTVEIQLASLNQENKSLSDNISNINKKLEDMSKIKDQIKNTSQMQEWFETFFVKLMSNMEKHIMVSIHREFNALLKEWFSILIDDIDIDLDDEFSVRIIQDGYETSIDSLSGGEKTSVALAYRLALNKVINDLIPVIKTKDLIILDEPTDGFSTEQLDRVRDVLEQLNMKQTIIVSHEPKMESYVQNIVRISKTDNISSTSV